MSSHDHRHGAHAHACTHARMHACGSSLASRPDSSSTWAGSCVSRQSVRSRRPLLLARASLMRSSEAVIAPGSALCCSCSSAASCACASSDCCSMSVRQDAVEEAATPVLAVTARRLLIAAAAQVAAAAPHGVCRGARAAPLLPLCCQHRPPVTAAARPTKHEDAIGCYFAALRDACWALWKICACQMVLPAGAEPSGFGSCFGDAAGPPCAVSFCFNDFSR